MIVGVDPKIDYAFKYLFGREVNRPILIDVLDSVLFTMPAGPDHSPANGGTPPLQATHCFCARSDMRFTVVVEAQQYNAIG